MAVPQFQYDPTAGTTYLDGMATKAIDNTGYVGGPEPYHYRDMLRNQRDAMVSRYAVNKDELSKALYYGSFDYINPTKRQDRMFMEDLAVLNRTYDEYLQTAPQQLLASNINLGSLSEALGTNNSRLLIPFIQKYSDTARNEFIRAVGREPLPEELASIFNKANFGGIASKDQTSFINNFDSLIKSDTGLSPATFLSTDAPKFQQVTQINNQLARFGSKLSADEISQITAPGNSLEQSAVIAQSYLNRQLDTETDKATNNLSTEQGKAIDTLDKQLQDSGKNFFSQMQPYLERDLASRGLLRSGNLGESFANQLTQIDTNRQGTLAPLRAEAAQATVKQNYGNLIRQALAGGQSLTEATRFANQIYGNNIQNSQNIFMQNLKDSQEQNMLNSKLSYALATTPRTQGPGALDYFLQYGLPVLGGLGQAGIQAHGRSSGNTGPH